MKHEKLIEYYIISAWFTPVDTLNSVFAHPWDRRHRGHQSEVVCDICCCLKQRL